MKKFKITKVQLRAIKDVTDHMSASLGGGNPDGGHDNHMASCVKAMDRFLMANGKKRIYK